MPQSRYAKFWIALFGFALQAAAQLIPNPDIRETLALILAAGTAAGVWAVPNANPPTLPIVGYRQPDSTTTPKGDEQP